MYIIIGIIVIPIYILLNIKYYYYKKVSTWINSKNLKVAKEEFFKFQLNSSFITSLILILFITIAEYLDFKSLYLPTILIPFYICLYITLYLAKNKGYLIKIKVS